MTTRLLISSAGALTSIQDAGRFGMLAYGVGASGPMDRGGFAEAAHVLGGAGAAGIEITAAGIAFEVMGGEVGAGFAGGHFEATFNGQGIEWPGAVLLKSGDRVSINRATAGNYGYLRFDRTLHLTPVLGSCSTNTRAGLGGLGGRSLQGGDVLEFGAVDTSDAGRVALGWDGDQPIRVLWGLHAELFSPDKRAAFLQASFRVTGRMDRMGVRLEDLSRVFATERSLSLVSDAIVPGDIQILGDGTPIVLMRDHQPTGGYPRIGTIISADFDRFAQLRPGQRARFTSVSLAHAQQAMGDLQA